MNHEIRRTRTECTRKLTTLQHVRESLPHPPHPLHPLCDPPFHRATHANTDEFCRERPPKCQDLPFHGRYVRRSRNRPHSHHHYPRLPLRPLRRGPPRQKARPRRKTLCPHGRRSREAHRDQHSGEKDDLRIPEPEMGHGFLDVSEPTSSRQAGADRRIRNPFRPPQARAASRHVERNIIDVPRRRRAL